MDAKGPYLLGNMRISRLMPGCKREAGFSDGEGCCGLLGVDVGGDGEYLEVQSLFNSV
jgi:hypothetical protein